MSLVLIGPVAEFAQAVEEHRPRQGVSGLALVQADVDAPAKLHILQVFQREEGAFEPAEFPQRQGQAVLPRIGPELAEHERRRDGALLDRGRQAQDLVPVGRDLLGVERRADEALQRRVAVRFLDGGEPLVGQVANARRESVAQEMAQREDVVGEPGGVGVMLLDAEVGFVVEQAVEHVRGVTDRGVDDLGVERGILIGYVRVEGHAGIVPVPGVYLAPGFPDAAGSEPLAVRG